MLEYRRKYYEEKVDIFLSKVDIDDNIKKILKEEMLKPVKVSTCPLIINSLYYYENEHY